MNNENQQINLHVKEGQNEVIIRHGAAEPVVPFRTPITVTGTLGVPRIHLTNPSKWLTKKQYPEDFLEYTEVIRKKIAEALDSPLQYSHLIVNRDKGTIEFVEDEGMSWRSSYKGVLALDPSFTKFKINTGESRTTLDLSNFIKMNRSHFETKDKAMLLVSELRNFKGKVDKEIENAADERGNRKILMAQAVETNIPESFVINVPVFKGYGNQTLEIEISIDPGDLSCSLVSPEVNDYIEDTKDNLINDELEAIGTLHPTLRIFEI